VSYVYGLSVVSSKHVLQTNENILLATASALLEFNYIYWFQKFKFYFGNHFLFHAN